MIHYIWNNYEALQRKYVSMEQMIEHIKLSPRIWNSQKNIIYVLKYFTWTLNININLLCFKRICIHHDNCYVLSYKFQNTLMKTRHQPVNTNNPINIVFHEKKYYVLSPNVDNYIPCLIKMSSSPSILLNGHTITTSVIKNIINNPPVDLPFSINIYTSYGYVQQSSTKQIQQQLIGQSKSSTSSEIFHIFLTPLLNTQSFLICSLKNNFDENNTFNIKNTFENPHITEGKTVNEKDSIKKEQLLNQENCICDHEETQRFISPTLNSFKKLSSSSQQKFFLYENLGMLSIIF